MKWLRKFFNWLAILVGVFMVNLKTGKIGSKPKRPSIHKIIFVEIFDGEFVTSEKWIIVNDRGETLEAPIFSTKKEAEDWLDEFHPKQNYAPE